MEAKENSMNQFHPPQPLQECPVLRGLIGGVGPDDLHEFHLLTKLHQHQFTTVAILHAGGCDDQSPDQAQGVNNEVSLAAKNFFPAS